MRLIDIEDFYNRDKYEVLIITKNEGRTVARMLDFPEIKAYTKDEVQKAIDKVEEYICNVETNTVKAQGMAQALDIFEQTLGGLEDGSNNQHN